MKKQYFLITERGYRVDLELDSEDMSVKFVWTPHPPPKEHFEETTLEYIPWRDTVIAEWAKETKRKILLATLDPHGRGASFVGFDETGTATYFTKEGVPLPPLRG